MEEKFIAINLTEKQQMEIERIIMDEDKDTALHFLIKLGDEIRKRGMTHCRPVFEK
jgi:hypothetical protein